MSESKQRNEERKIKVLVAKLGLEGNDRGLRFSKSSKICRHGCNLDWNPLRIQFFNEGY